MQQWPLQLAERLPDWRQPAEMAAPAATNAALASATLAAAVTAAALAHVRNHVAEIQGEQSNAGLPKS